MLQDQGSTIHLLLTDIVMPQINGFELAKTARELRAGIRVLYMSGYTDNHVTANWTVDPDTPFPPQAFHRDHPGPQSQGSADNARRGRVEWPAHAVRRPADPASPAQPQHQIHQWLAIERRRRLIAGDLAE